MIMLPFIYRRPLGYMAQYVKELVAPVSSLYDRLTRDRPAFYLGIAISLGIMRQLFGRNADTQATNQ